MRPRRGVAQNTGYSEDKTAQTNIIHHTNCVQVQVQRNVHEVALEAFGSLQPGSGQVWRLQ